MFGMGQLAQRFERRAFKENLCGYVFKSTVTSVSPVKNHLPSLWQEFFLDEERRKGFAGRF
jgi:hypothetical protein